MIIATERLTKSGRLELTATGDVDIPALGAALEKGCGGSLCTRTAPELDEDKKPTGAMLPTVYKARCEDHAAAKAIFEAHTGAPLPVDPVEAGEPARIRVIDGVLWAVTATKKYPLPASGEAIDLIK